MTYTGFRLTGRNAVTTRPADKTQVVAGSTWARDRSSVGADDGTEIDATWVNRVRANLENLMTALGGNLGDGDNQIANAVTAYIAAEIAALVASSPAALNTLNELATALGNDPNFATTITNALAAKAPLASPPLTGTPTAPTAAPGTNSTQIATTAFAKALVDATAFAGVPARLGTGAVQLTDWNSATENGWYYGSDTASNTPAADGYSYYGIVIGISANILSQIVRAWDGVTGGDTTRAYRRDRHSGTWGAWYQVELSVAEMNSRYAAIGSLASGVDLNAALTSGFYRLTDTHANMPSGLDFGQLIVSRNGDTLLQIGASYDSNRMLFRSGFGIGGTPTFGAWRELWHSGNDGTTSGLDADLLDGQHASAFATAGHTHSEYAAASHTHAGMASINDQTSAGSLSFPVGVTLLVDSGAGEQTRNSTAPIYLGSGGRYSLVESGSALTGTWRCCGATGGIHLYQRVA